MFIFNFKKLPNGLFIVILLIFIFEIGNYYFDDYFYRPRPNRHAGPGLIIKTKNKIALSGEHAYDVIILGDSHSHAALIPEIIKEKTGLSCFNFSLYSPQMYIGSYMLLKNYLNNHEIKPKFMVIAFDPFTVYSNTKEFYKKSAISTLVNLKKRNLKLFFEEFGISQGLKFFLPSIKHQSRFRDFIENPFSYKIDSKNKIDDIINQVYINKGYFPIWKWKETASNEKIRREYNIMIKEYDLEQFTVSPFSLKYLKGILELARKNKIKPIFYVPTLPGYVFNKVDQSNYMNQYNDFMDSLKVEYPDLVLLNFGNFLNMDEMFLDIHHVSKDGGMLLSDYLSSKLNILYNEQIAGQE